MPMPTQTSSVPDLWGQFPKAAQGKSPSFILEQQATVLTQKTNGLLQGQVSLSRHTPGRGSFFITLLILAPSLDNYNYEALSVIHEIPFYPAKVIAEEGEVQCNDEAEFEKAVASVLQSERIRKLVSGLLALMHQEA
jgi:hypothetical protein